MQHGNGPAISCVLGTNDWMKVQMPRGAYTSKQQRKAEHIEEGYEKRGVSEREAERRAWATVNKMDHGGKEPGGSGRGKPTDKSPSRKGGRKGGAASAARPKSAR